MFKKILSLLLLPLCAVAAFVGCSKERTVSEVQNYYNSMKNKYIVEETSGVYSSNIFPKQQGTVKSFGDGIKVQYTGDLSFLGDDNKEVDAEDAYGEQYDTLYWRYMAIKEIQQPTLDAIFAYYTKYNDNFFNGIQLTDKKVLDSKDITALYNKLVDLDDELQKFVVERNKFQQVVDILGVKDIDRSIITTYSRAFNDLIKVSYEFVEEFKNIHVKYIWKDNEYDSFNGIGSLQTINRIIDEANLEQAYVQYLELSAFNDSECDLSEYAKVKLKTGSAEINYFDLLGQQLTTSSESLIKITKYVNQQGQQTDVNGVPYSAEEIELWKTNDKSEAEQNYISKLNYSIDVFNQKLDKIKEIANDVNLYKYYRIKFGQDTSLTLEQYKDNLSKIEQANLMLFENFMNETVNSYRLNIHSLFDNYDCKLCIVVVHEITS